MDAADDYGRTSLSFSAWMGCENTTIELLARGSSNPEPHASSHSFKINASMFTQTCNNVESEEAAFSVS